VSYFWLMPSLVRPRLASTLTRRTGAIGSENSKACALARSFTSVSSGTSNVVPATAAVVEAAVSTALVRAVPIVRGPVVSGAGPGVQPIHGSDQTIVSGG
jgi:hypothetical protein